MSKKKLKKEVYILKKQFQKYQALHRDECGKIHNLTKEKLFEKIEDIDHSIKNYYPNSSEFQSLKNKLYEIEMNCDEKKDYSNLSIIAICFSLISFFISLFIIYIYN